MKERTLLKQQAEGHVVIVFLHRLFFALNHCFDLLYGLGASPSTLFIEPVMATKGCKGIETESGYIMLSDCRASR